MNYLIHTIEHNEPDLHRYRLYSIDVGFELFITTRNKMQKFNDSINNSLCQKNKVIIDYDDFTRYHLSNDKKLTRTYDNSTGSIGSTTVIFIKLDEDDLVLKGFESKIVKRSLFDQIMDSEINIDTIEYISNNIISDSNKKIITSESVMIKSKDGLHFRFTDNADPEFIPVKSQDNELYIQARNGEGAKTIFRGWGLSLDSFIDVNKFAHDVDEGCKGIFEGKWYSENKTLGKLFQVHTMPYNEKYMLLDRTPVLLLRNPETDTNLVVSVEDFHNNFVLA